jgi:hypothetical protein
MYTTMLELAISMVLLFLMLSAASSAIQEIIANIFRWRAKTLEKGIEGLLQSKTVKDELYQLPIIQSLSSPNARGQLTHRPSYIPSSTLALAVLNWAEKKGIDLAKLASTPGGSQAAAESADVPSAVTELLQSLMSGSKDFEEQKKRLEDWFDNSMGRISGWYKRRSNVALWIIGILLCLLVNADSISLSNAFWKDQTLRSAMVVAATKYVENGPKPNASTAKTDSSGNATAGPNAGKTQPATPAPSGNPASATSKKMRHKSDNSGAAKAVQAVGGNQSGAQIQEGAPNGQIGDHSGAGGASGQAGDAQATNGNDPFQRLDDVRKILAKAAIPLGWCWYVDEDQKEKKCFPELNPVRFSVKGNGGKTTYYYWIVVNHAADTRTLYGPFSISDAPDTLSDENYVIISWPAEPEAKSYDILRTGKNQLPIEICECAVGKGVSSLTTNDKRASLQNYDLNAPPVTEDAAIGDLRLVPSSGIEWFLKLLGIALTALAISQGAPFWFDLLQKAVNLRLAGDAPDEKQKKK